ncbi:MAG: hAT transposon family protein [Hydrogenophaga sp.]|uniref:hAT family dimerization domain-containing protein n=1 Tax=Hydrogenophaga sp. TaxID=1904254 RepID=UPI00262960F9|nr:hAT family dimerization domain-containing protein [Hydrogenophaga sp.]MCW5672852.1 hAT transposon family protein [Hydrogenophaga sp.]
MQLDPNDDRVCLCRLCSDTPTTIKLGAGGGVYNFKFHLYRFHPCFLSLEDVAKIESDNRRAAPVAKRRREKCGAESLERSIVDVLGVSPMPNVADELALLVVLGGFPLLIGESPALRHFTLTVSRGAVVSLPGRRAVAARIVGMHKAAVSDIARRVARAMEPLHVGEAVDAVQLRNQCSVTLDEWTSAGVQPYMSTTLHFVDETWRLQAFTIACRPQPHPHTGEALREALRANLDAVNNAGDGPRPLALDDLAGIATDGARNVLAVTNGSLHQRVRCASHGIQLALSLAAGDADFQAFMKPVSRYYAALARSPQRREWLAIELRACGRKVLMPVYPVRTRWNSHYDALRRFVEIAPGLQRMTHTMLGLATAAERDELALQAAATLAAAPLVLDVLRPFDAWTKRLTEARSVTLSLVPRAIGELLQVAQTPAAGGDGAACVANVLRARVCVQLRRIFADVLEPPPETALLPVHMARFLDPRTVGEIVVRAEHGDAGDAPYTPESLAMIGRVLTRLRQQLPREPARRRIPNWIERCGGMANGSDREPVLALSADVDEYLQRTVGAEAGDMRNVDPLAWWRAAAPELPTLAGFARRYLAAPATTAASERLFSLAGVVVGPARTRLGPDRVNELVVTRAYYIKALRDEKDKADEGEQLDGMLDEGTVSVDEDGYVEAAPNAEASPFWTVAPLWMDTQASHSRSGECETSDSSADEVVCIA